MTSGKRAALSLSLALAAHAGGAAAFSAAELMRELATVERSRATFVETRHSALLKEPLVLRGTLAYRRPAALEKHVTQPYDELVRLDGDSLTIDNRTRGRKLKTSVSGAPAIAALVESIRATRAGDLAALERHFALRVEGSAARWTLSLKPRDEELARRVASITVSGAAAGIARIEIQEAGGDRAVMEIREEIE